jgi:hypothetical protein
MPLRTSSGIFSQSQASPDLTRYRGVAGHGRGEARSASPQNQIGHTADNRSYQGAAGKPRGDQCGPARYMLEVESGPELETHSIPNACRLRPRRLHDAAGYSGRSDGSRNPGRAARTKQVLALICATAASTPNWSRLRRTGRSNRMLHLLLRQCARKRPSVN